MESLILDPKADKPGVIIDPTNNKFELYGKSLPEDTNDFFDPIISFFDSYSLNPNKKTEFVFNLEYYNSASVRKIVSFLTILEKMYKNNHDVKVIWKYEETDEIMKDNGEDFKETVDIPFEIISFKFDF